MKNALIKRMDSYRFNFGVNKGKSILKAGANYVYWCVDNVKFFPFNENDIEEYILYKITKNPLSINHISNNKVENCDDFDEGLYFKEDFCNDCW